MQKQFAEVQTIKKKENHREELERKVRDTHRMLMHDYPVYYDWWLQDGNDAKDIKDGKDVNGSEVLSVVAFSSYAEAEHYYCCQ